MNEALINNINSMVTDKDVLYILGDFSFYQREKNKEIISRINAPVVLIKGNHDQSNRIKNVPFAEVYDELDIWIKDIVVTLSHYPYWLSDSTYFDYKPTTEQSQPGRFKDKRPVDVGLWLLHGHTHNKERVNAKYRMIHVGVDANQYAPLSELDIYRIINDNRNT